MQYVNQLRDGLAEWRIIKKSNISLSNIYLLCKYMLDKWKVNVERKAKERVERTIEWISEDILVSESLQEADVYEKNDCCSVCRDRDV